MVSGLKSNTTPGGGGYNEMSMNDTKGKERVTIHAQYDMGTTVEHDQTNTVNNKFTETIKNDATIKITEGKYNHDVVANTADYHVQGALTEKYDTTQTTTVKGDITTKSTTGAIVVSADASKIYIHAATNIELHTGASKLRMDSAGNISLEGVNVTISGSSLVTVKGLIVHSEASAEHQIKGAIVISEGSATNTIKGGMVMLNP
jgi:type VI secretion system secreted protein VgrG